MGNLTRLGAASVYPRLGLYIVVFLSLYCSKFNYYNDYRNLNKKPKVDVRQKFKVFVLRNGESVERVVYGFPVECFVINEHAPIRVFTSDSGNSSDFFF